MVEGRAATARQVEAVEAAYADIERFYRAGEATDLDVQDLRRQLINAQILFSNLETDETLALYTLRYRTGLPAVEIQ